MTDEGIEGGCWARISAGCLEGANLAAAQPYLPLQALVQIIQMASVVLTYIIPGNIIWFC